MLSLVILPAPQPVQPKRRPALKEHLHTVSKRFLNPYMGYFGNKQLVFRRLAAIRFFHHLSLVRLGQVGIIEFLHQHLFTLDNHAGFAETHQSRRGFQRSQTGFLHLVRIPPGFRSAYP